MHASLPVGRAQYGPGQPVYYDINTTATFSGPLTVCIRYDDTQVHGTESKLKLMHYDDMGFVNITTSLDTVNNVICGITATLSPFALIEPETTPASPVGGIAELPDMRGDAAGEPTAPPRGSRCSPGTYATLVGGLVATLLTVTAAASYARKRRHKA